MPEEQSEKFKKFIIHHYIFVSIILIVIILFLGYFLLLVPQYKGWQEKKKEINNLGEELKQKQEEIIALKGLKEEYNKIDQEKIQKIDQFLPYGEDLPNLYIQLETLAKDSGLILSSIETSDVTEKDSNELPANIGVIEVKIKLEGGNYSILKSFLKETENNLRIFDIVSLDFPEKVDSFNITLRTYFLK